MLRICTRHHATAALTTTGKRTRPPVLTSYPAPQRPWLPGIQVSPSHRSTRITRAQNESSLPLHRSINPYTTRLNPVHISENSPTIESRLHPNIIMAPQPIGTKKISAKTAQARALQLNKKPAAPTQPTKKPTAPSQSTKKPVTPAQKKTPVTTTKVIQPTKSHAPIGTKKPPPKPLPAPPKPAQSQGWIGRTVSTAASGVGSFASAIAVAAGNGVAGAGKGASARYVSFVMSSPICLPCSRSLFISSEE